MTDLAPARVAEAAPASAGVVQPRAEEAKRPNRAPGKWRSLLPSPVQAMATIIAILCASNLGLWAALHRAANGAPVSVVGVREMTSKYLSQVQSSSMSPQEVSARTSLFLSLAQDEVRRYAAANPGRLVLARECVLGGDQTDLTPAISRAVDTRLETTSQALAASAGASGASEMSAFLAPAAGPIAATRPSPLLEERRVPLSAGGDQ